ncbi:DUF159 family protein [Pseudomonas cavernicola]|uniref:Abasic site processing protein n=1 Tax=Pseudomonas cavernicola TaxID=2320866 RepID=A0A418XEX8_9PSED|nr:SOS response-associated peptidase family protein [Pseudomonas cavernicola]RJG10957.1 DUF159 family protein [Pseudomonas cavernicola]
MCGRLSQYRGLHEFAAVLNTSPEEARLLSDQPIERYNVAPHSYVQLLRTEGDVLIWDVARWRWVPEWAEKGPKNDFNARREIVATSKFYRQIWHHRALVCADGWFEWVVIEGESKKQPYYITPKDGSPLFLPAIGLFSARYEEPRDSDGFRIITADSEGGMLDVHDRRPVVLAPDLAREWLDLATPPEAANDILQYHTLPAEHFRWYPVTKDVGNVRNDYPELIQPIADALL